MVEEKADDFGKTHARKDDVDTSKIASRLAEPNAVRHKGIVLKVLKERGPMTSQEIAKATGLNYYQCARRVPDLRNDGLVVDTGMRRKNGSGRSATVWALREDSAEQASSSKNGTVSKSAEIKRLRAALREIMRVEDDLFGGDTLAYEIAREALGDD